MRENKVVVLEREVRTEVRRNKEKHALPRKLVVGLHETLLKAQGGVCWICGKPPGKRNLAVDHDHLTGKVRGLLCYNCNVGLGHFQDNPALLLRAIDYLKQ